MQEKGSDTVKGVIFDLDGTLIDSFRAIMEGFNAALPLYGLGKLDLEETKALVGRPLPETLGELVGRENAKEATTAFRKRYKEIYLDKTVPLAGATEALHHLAAGGYALGIATNKHGGFSRKIIEHLGWSRSISSVVGEGDTVESKPHPDMILKNLELLGLKASEALFVGDSPVDIEAGRNAGIRTVAIPTGYHSKEMLKDAGAEEVIENLMELKEII